MRHSDKHLTTDEKNRAASAAKRRDRATARGKHDQAVVAEREINAIYDGASDRERD